MVALAEGVLLTFSLVIRLRLRARTCVLCWTTLKVSQVAIDAVHMRAAILCDKYEYTLFVFNYSQSLLIVSVYMLTAAYYVSTSLTLCLR